jgi:hypothetical protein
MDANNNSCALEHTIDAPAIEAPETLPPGGEDVTPRDVRPASSGIINISKRSCDLPTMGSIQSP